MRLRGTVFWRLVVGLAAVSVLAMAATAAFLYVRFDSIDTRFRDDTLRSFAENLARDIQSSQEPIPIAVQPTGARISEAGGTFAIVSPTQGVVAGSAGISAALFPLEPVNERLFALPRMLRNKRPVYGLSFRINGPQPLFAQVAFPSSPVLYDSVLEEFIQDVAWIWFVFLLVILATNLAVARIALKPLDEAVEQVERIGPGSVAIRLTEGKLPGDVLVLVKAVNHALDRLHSGFRSLEEFVEDVAHELRTPLAVIKAQLAVSEMPLARLLEQDFLRMERLVQQLLDRMRLNGIRFEADDIVELGEVAREVVGFLAPLAIAKGRSIEVLGGEIPVQIVGARDYIFRALRNLIENAIEHTPTNSIVSVILTGAPSIAVRDHGPGFPAAMLAAQGRPPEPFRSGRQGGVGLGLSIVQRTMIAHDGELEIANHSQGALAIMRFSSEDRLLGRSAAE
ncbi:ATP-binding protein [Bradyrhizobium sp.]|uniref:sensor histidine kinase n=1 Tax=Bradyrhizobium sp. TaxID=376 RepID=UPI0025C4F6D6|nr:ATP-binding protein [Bradyrhizobium sp.]